MGSLNIKQLVKSYGDLQVVHGIDLEIQRGEFIVLVGPSGCGKSTTLRMIAGLEEITNGTIEIDNKTVNDLPPKDRDIAMVFQNYALYPHMTVRQNMSFALKLQKTPIEKIKSSVDEAAQILGLEELLDRKPNELSGGQRQRVAMGRAIVRKPKVFLFDEPLSNLDAKLRTQMRAEIKRLHYRMGTTIVYVTHDQVEAMTLADRIVIMNGGRIEQVGTPDEIYTHPANRFVANFIGSPPMNLIDDKDHFAKWDESLKNEIASKNLTVGIRPEHFNTQGHGHEITGHIHFMEPLGGETLVHVSKSSDSLVSGDENIIAKIPAQRMDSAFSVGKPISLFVKTEFIRKFPTEN